MDVIRDDYASMVIIIIKIILLKTVKKENGNDLAHA